MPFFNSFKAWILVLGTHGIKGVWFRACSIPLGSSWHLEFPLHNTLCPWPPPALTRTGRSPVSSTRSKAKWCRGAEPEPPTSSWARRARQPEEMCRGCHCGGLASLLLLVVLLLLGQNLGLLIEIPQDAVSGTVGQSVLLPVSYRINSSLLFPLSILWKFGSSSQVIVTCTAQNCSLDAWGTPTNCSAICYPHVTYRGRAAVFPENASLLLWDLQLNDSGLYSVTFTQQNLSRQITLAVHKQHGSTERPDKGSEVEATPNYYTIGVCSLTGLLLLFLVLCTWWRGMVWKKMRTITQQQASNTADIHMENTVVGDMTTVYATIREDFEETKPRALPETLYTSISFPQYYSALAPNSAGDRSAAEPR